MSAYVDTDGDGRWDVKLADADGDGKADCRHRAIARGAPLSMLAVRVVAVEIHAVQRNVDAQAVRGALSPARPRWSRERLRDRQPLRGVGADGRHVQLRPRPSLGDQHAEVLGRPGDALRGVVGAPRPRRAVRRAQLHVERFRGRESSPLMANAKSRVRTPMWAIERSRAVAGRFTPSASATSRPCAQVSISRAVAIDAALIGGPNHGSLRPSATREQFVVQPGPGRGASRPAVGRAGARPAPRRPRRRNRSGPWRPRPAPSAKPASSVTAVSATRSVHSRCAI